MINVDAKKYEAFCKEACVRMGLSYEAADATAHYLVETDKLGTFTHGTLNLLPYMKKVEAGGIAANAKLETIAEGPAWAVMDGGDGMGYYNAREAIKLGMRKARETGVSYIVVRNSSHYGACGVYSVEGAENGFITVSATNVAKTMTVPGGRGGIIGNAPFSYAVPKGKKHPMVFLDIATSNIAGMKVNRAKAAGQQVPPGSIVDENGLPTTDPNTNWALYPLGGHKGYGMALFIEVLTSVISGGQILDVPLWIKDSATLCPYSHMFMFIDTRAFMPMDEFEDRMDHTVEEIAQAPKAQGSEHIYMPGEMEWARYDRAEKEGLMLPEDVERNARELAGWLKLDLDVCKK